MDTELDFSNLSEILISLSSGENGITFIESEKSEYFLSYGEIYEKAAYALYNLQQFGIKPRDEVVFQIKHNRDFLIIFWACILGKMIPVPVTLANNEEYGLKLINIWNTLNNPYLITFKKQQEWFQDYADNNQKSEIFNKMKDRTLLIEDIETAARTGKFHMPGASDIAHIQFSSGSTGTPKGVILTHKNLLCNIQGILKSFGTPENGIDRYFSWMPLTHDLGLVCFHLTALVGGWNQALMDTQLFVRRPQLWLTRMSALKSTVTCSPNFGYKYVLRHLKALENQQLDLSPVRIIVDGAEPISPQLCDEFLQALACFGLRETAILPGYGLAEASVAATLSRPEDKVFTVRLDRNSINCGMEVRQVNDDANTVDFVKVGPLVEGCSVKIADEKGNTCSDYVIGEILIKGDNVSPGYYNNSEATRNTISPDGWLRTGDLGFLINDQLVITGRAKDIIFVNGQNYYPHDMERLVEELEEIQFERVAFCGAFNQEIQSEEIVCFVVFKKSVKELLPLAKSLKNLLMEKMGVEVSRVIPVKKIPKTTSGKLQRFKLKEQYLQGHFDKVLAEIDQWHNQLMMSNKPLSKPEVKELIIKAWSEVLNLDREKIGEGDHFFELGGNSNAALRVKARLQEIYGKHIDDATLFKYPTIETLTNYLSSDGSGEKISREQKEYLESFSMNRRRTWERIKKHLTNGDETGKHRDRSGLEIAVIGMSGRFPGARDIEEFWANIKNGRESISFFSEDELIDVGIDPQLLQDCNYVKAKGILEGIDYFDAGFFGYSPQDAGKMDPQMRILHECSWETLENAGYNPGDYSGLIGVYVGASPNPQWESTSILSPSWRMSASTQFVDTQLIDKDFMTTRLSYKLNLKGPSFSMYTACSTSLVAVDLACQGLWTGKCDMALAGGVSIWLPQKTGYLYEKEMIFSRDGHNRTFDEQATGTIFSDGAGIVLLKRLVDAIEDNDHIYAVIKGSAVNNDGQRKAGYTAPALVGQAEVIVAALQMAGVEPESIGYLEAHGTATTLGDHIEMDALNSAFHTSKKGYCAIGSVKSNIGHINAAAGVAGLIKTVLMLKHGLLPPCVNFTRANPGIHFADSPFYIDTSLREWGNGSYQHTQLHPRRAGVSSFGIGGTNAHVILEEWIAGPSSSETSRKYSLMVLSARTQTALYRMTENLAEYFKTQVTEHNNYENQGTHISIPALNLADAAFTLQVGRPEFRHRRMVVCATADEAAHALSKSLDEETVGTHTFSTSHENQEPAVVFMFSGLGSQYVNMGLDLYREEPDFREEMNRCFEILLPLMDCDVKEILYPGEGRHTPSQLHDFTSREETPGTGDKPQVANNHIPDIDRTEIAQVVIFILEYALAKLLIRWGIKPDAMIGYSFGEYIAACVSGVFSLEDALKLVVQRGKLIQKIPAGTMLSVPLPSDQLIPLLDQKQESELSLAIDNGASCIVSGSPEAVIAFEKKLKEKKLMCMRVPVSHALHSLMMEPILEDFTEYVSQIKCHRPQIPYISNVTGNWLRHEELNPGYWPTHLRRTVRFSDGINVLLKEMKNTVMVEIGPGRDLSALVVRYIENNPEKQILHLLRPPQKKVSDVYFLLEKIGKFWLYGKRIDWNAFYGNEKRQRIPLPAYPFEKQHYQAATSIPILDIRALPGKESIEKKPDIADWFYIPSWKRLQITANHLNSHGTAETAEKSSWLIFSDSCGVGSELVKNLRQKSREVIIVTPGQGFSKVNDEQYTIDPEQGSDYEELLALYTSGEPGKNPLTIIHLWSITGEVEEQSRNDFFTQAQRSGLFSLVSLAKATRKVELSSGYRFMVISSHLQEITGEEELCPAKSTILGAVKVIPQEYPNITCRSIDIFPVKSGTRQEQRLIEQLTDECLAESGDITVGYRNNYRWVQTFEPIRLEEAPADIPRLRHGGVYLITGGLGGIGFTLAEYLARAVQAKLILTSRSHFPGRDGWDKWLADHGEEDRTTIRINRIRELEKLGAEVLTFSADSADREAMEQVIDQSETKLGGINGVIHAAGVVGGKSFNILDQLDKSMFELQFQPKVYGLMVLEEILKDRPLDFFLVTSSLSPILGGLTMGAYAAANQFMDSFVLLHNRKSPVSWMSLNWGDWQPWKHSDQESGVGAEHGKLNMKPDEGVESFRRILHHGRGNQVIVSAGDLKTRLHRWVEREIVKECDKPGEENPTLLHQRPALLKSFPYEPPRNPIEQVLVDTWQKSFGFAPIGIRDDFFDLGGDSLKAVMASYKIHKALEVEIPLKEFFDKPTIAELAEYIEGNKEKGHQQVEIKMVETKEYYALSSAQLRIYFLQQLDKGSIAYNETQVLIFDGLLDKQKLENVHQQLIRRHDSYKTSIIMVNEVPKQRLHHISEVNSRIEMLPGPGRALSQEANENEIKTPGSIEEIILNFIRPFDLSQVPLLRMALIEMDERKHFLVFDKHHIVNDGTSEHIFIEEIIELYSGRELPLLRLHYKDYAEWQDSPVQKQAREKQKEYWLRQFDGEVSRLNLPTDYPRPSYQDFSGNILEFELNKDKAAALRDLVAKQKATLFVVLLSIFNVLLAKLGGQEDIIVGTPVVGRGHGDLENMIGMFVNTLVLRNQTPGTLTFSNFIERVKANTLNAMKNQDYPFEELVEHISVSRDVSRNPLFDVMFLMQNADLPQVEIPNLSIKLHNYSNKTAKFDLTLKAVEEAGKLHFAFEYSTALYKAETINRYAGYLNKILSSVLENPERKISGIEILSEKEKQQVLYDFNDSRVEYPENKTLHGLFAEQAERIPDRTALVARRAGMGDDLFTPVSLSYHELDRQSRQLALLLRQKGIRPGTIAAIMVQPSIEMIAGILGILKAGGTYLPINPENPVERINYLLADSRTHVVITANGFSPGSPTGTSGSPGTPDTLDKRDNESIGIGQKKDIKTDILDSLEFSIISSSHLPGDTNSVTSRLPDSEVHPGSMKGTHGDCLDSVPSNNLAYIIYTSGTTGRPKGVMVRHQGFINLIYFHRKVFGENQDSRMSQVANPDFDAMAFEIWPCLSCGAGLYIADNETRRDPGKMKQWLIEKQITISFQPTVMVEQLLAQSWPASGVALKALRAAGDRLSRYPAQPYPFTLYNLYGPTEDTVWTTWTEVAINPKPITLPTIGKPIGNHQIYILNTNSALQPIGIPGELCIAGVGLAVGYLNRPEMTAEKFGWDFRNDRDYHDKFQTQHNKFNKTFLQGVQGDGFHKKSPPGRRRQTLYKTGDLARWLLDGNIEFLGRGDRQVKIRGFRIELGEIEKLLLNHEKIKEAVVQINNNNGADDKYICAYIVSPHDIPASQLRNYLANHLPAYMIPSYFQKIEQIPLTPNGKIDIKKLESLSHHLNTGIEYVPPRNQLEKQIAEVWMKTLNVEKVGMNDNFFDIGGNSIRVISLNNKLNSILDMEIPTTIFFERMTIRLFVDYLNSMGMGQTDESRYIDRTESIKDMKQQRKRRKGKRGGISNVSN